MPWISNSSGHAPAAVREPHDAVEKLFFSGPTVPEGDGECLPRGQRTLIALLIASFSQAKFRAQGKESFSTASLPIGAKGKRFELSLDE